MPTYQNIDVSRGNSSFADISNPAGPNMAHFKSAVNNVQAVGQAVQFARMDVSLVRPFIVTCGESCDRTFLNESAKITLNLKVGEDPTELVTEVKRLLDIAIADYGFDRGLVPPASATLASE